LNKTGNDFYTAIVIAAGLSSRMDGFKPLLDVGGKPAIIRLLDTILEAGLRHIVVVTGFGRELIEEAIDTYTRQNDIIGTTDCVKSRKRVMQQRAQRGGKQSGNVGISMDCRGVARLAMTNDVFSHCLPSSLCMVYNANYESGMFGSVKAGIKGIMETDSLCPETAALLFPVDVPLVSVRTVTGLISAFERGQTGTADCVKSRKRVIASVAKQSRNVGIPMDCRGVARLAMTDDVFLHSLTVPLCPVKRRPFAVPVFEGRNGHPLLIPGGYFEEILAYAGKGGLKGVRSLYDADMIRYDVNDEGCVLDMDTREDYAKLLEYDERQKQEE
jgi:CTP:molybdopterin cytidylyltransferase MocA